MFPFLDVQMTKSSTSVFCSLFILPIPCAHYCHHFGNLGIDQVRMGSVHGFLFPCLFNNNKYLQTSKQIIFLTDLSQKPRTFTAVFLGQSDYKQQATISCKNVDQEKKWRAPKYLNPPLLMTKYRFIIT